MLYFVHLCISWNFNTTAGVFNCNIFGTLSLAIILLDVRRSLRIRDEWTEEPPGNRETTKTVLLFSFDYWKEKQKPNTLQSKYQQVRGRSSAFTQKGRQQTASQPLIRIHTHTYTHVHTHRVIPMSIINSKIQHKVYLFYKYITVYIHIDTFIKDMLNNYLYNQYYFLCI